MLHLLLAIFFKLEPEEQLSLILYKLQISLFCFLLSFNEIIFGLTPQAPYLALEFKLQTGNEDHKSEIA